MKCGILGGSSQERSLPFNAERTVNLFPVLDQQGKESGSLYGTPGQKLFCTAGTGPGRGGFSSTNGRAFYVSGTSLYEISSAGVTTLRGALDNIGTLLTMDENGFQLAICDSVSLYIFTYATNTFVKVSSPNLPSAYSVTFIDGYFVVNRSATSGIFQISSLYDGTTWAALDFATAESSPDALLRVINILGQLWLQGAKTTEIWSNVGGGASFPFQRIGGGKMETGVQSPYSSIALDNSCFWNGRDNNGSGIIYRAQGFTPQRISTDTIEKRIQSAPLPDTIRSYSYQEGGHTFYIVTGGGMETTLCYDLATGIWHERAYLNDAGFYELHIGAYCIFAFGKQLVLDRRNGNVYEQNLDFYSDNGEEIARDRTFTHIFDENQRVQFLNLTVGFQTGVGLQTGQGSDPKASLYISRDGAQTWSGAKVNSIGKVGQYLARVVWRRLGQSRQMTFRVRVTDPVKVCITGGYFNTP